MTSDPSPSATLVLPSQAELRTRAIPQGLELTLQHGHQELSAILPYDQVETFRRILAMLPLALH